MFLSVKKNFNKFSLDDIYDLGQVVINKKYIFLKVVLHVFFFGISSRCVNTYEHLRRIANVSIFIYINKNVYIQGPLITVFVTV